MSYSCPIKYCGMSLSSRDERDLHLYNDDHIQNFYECPYVECPHRYRSTYGIARHLVRIHHKTEFDIKPITVVIRLAGKNMTLPNKI